MLHLLSCQLTVANEDELLLLEFGIWNLGLHFCLFMQFCCMTEVFFKGDI